MSSGIFRQALVSPSLVFFREDFHTKFDLAEYHDPEAPAVFFGCYTSRDLKAIARHQGPRLIIWAGTDAWPRHRRARARLTRVATLGETYNVAISEFVAKDLATYGLGFVRLPVTPVDLQAPDLDLRPMPRGPKVYVYTSEDPARREVYGQSLVARVQSRLPDLEFITCHARSVPRSELPEIYRQCFIGLRLVAHDGLPNTVVELAMMGRRTVHNGGLPSSLPWKTEQDVVELVRQEQGSIGSVDDGVAARTAEYLTLPKDWLTVPFLREHVSRPPVRLGRRATRKNNKRRRVRRR